MTGQGIAPESLLRLFQPFERIGAEQTAIEGTGLGLAHSKALAERMGGRIGVDSTLESGSSFWLELRRSAEPTSTCDPNQSFQVVAEPTRRWSARCLYVEDNAANLRLVERALERRPGVRFLSAMLGRVGLDLAREHHPDLIVLDLNLPDIGGDQVLAALRAEPLTRGIPVLVLSADATQRQRQRLLALGAQAYLTKPLDVRNFLATLDDPRVTQRQVDLIGRYEPRPAIGCRSRGLGFCPNLSSCPWLCTGSAGGSDWCRPAKQIPLAEIDPERAKLIALTGGLDAFGDELAAALPAK